MPSATAAPLDTPTPASIEHPTSLSAPDPVRRPASAPDTNVGVGGDASRPPTEVERPAMGSARSEPLGTAGSGEGLDEHGYPEQRHAGKVGYGPNYHRGPTMGEKIKGEFEIVEGKMLGKPEKVEEGEMRKSGELKLRKEHDKDIAQDPFQEKHSQGTTAKGPVAQGTTTHGTPVEQIAESVRRGDDSVKDTAAVAGTKST